MLTAQDKGLLINDSTTAGVRGSIPNLLPPALHTEVQPAILMQEAGQSMTLGGAPVDTFEGFWYVARVRGTGEIQLAERLAEREIPYFLPLENVPKAYQKSRYPRHRALFTGYVFFCGDDGTRYRVLDTNLCVGPTAKDRIITVLSCALQRKLREELSALHRMLLASPKIYHRYNVGQEVEIRRDLPKDHEYYSLRGQRGFVDSDDSGSYFSILITLLNASVSMQIDPSDVREIS